MAWVWLDQYKVQKQALEDWCWAAVTASVSSYYDGQAGAPQGLIAEQVLGLQPGTCNPPASADRARCNKIRTLDQALRKIGHFCTSRTIPSAPSTANPLSSAQGRFNDLKREIDAHRPLGVQIYWDGSATGSHYVAITGYWEDTTDYILVKDPLFDESQQPNSSEESEATFPANYPPGMGGPSTAWGMNFYTRRPGESAAARTCGP